MIKKSGFTLAEVLITMSIIGVVSALTIPALMQNYQQEAQTVQLRKFSNDFVNAVDMLITEEGKTKFYNTSVYTDVLPNNKPAGPEGNADGLAYFIENHFRVTTTCAAEGTGCFADVAYRAINGTATEEPDEGEGEGETEEGEAESSGGTNGVFKCSNKSYVLANGAAICVIKGENKGDLTVYMDTNGKEKPNIGGRDMFTFNIDGATGNIKGTSGGCTNSVYGDGCYNLLAGNAWKMDY